MDGFNRYFVLVAVQFCCQSGICTEISVNAKLGEREEVRIWTMYMHTLFYDVEVKFHQMLNAICYAVHRPTLISKMLNCNLKQRKSTATTKYYCLNTRAKV